MINKIKKKLNGMEKICLVGAIAGMSLLFYGTGLDIYNSMINQDKKNNFTSRGAGLLLLSGIGYFISSKNKDNSEDIKKY